MSKATKKPIKIDSHFWDDKNHRAMFEFLGGKADEYISLFGNHFYIDHDKVKGGLIIKTLEGEMIANIGDYIIKGVKGEFYPCKPDIFKLTYDEAGE
jgi:hypothetical protein